MSKPVIGTELLDEFYADARNYQFSPKRRDGRARPRSEAQKQSLVKARAARMLKAAKAREQRQRDLEARLDAEDEVFDQVIPATPPARATPVQAPGAPARPPKKRVLPTPVMPEAKRQLFTEPATKPDPFQASITLMLHNQAVALQRIQQLEMGVRSLYDHVLLIQSRMIRTNPDLGKPE